MTKLKIDEIFADLTFKKIKKKIEQNRIVGLNKKLPNFQPTFEVGNSIFTERKPWYVVWRRKEVKLIHLEGSLTCFAIREGEEKEIDVITKGEDGKEVITKERVKQKYFWNTFGSMEETQKYIKKSVAQARANLGEAIGHWQVMAILLMLTVVIMLQIMVLRGQGTVISK
jgi:hypothetical protein